MKDRDGKNLKIGDRVRFYTADSSEWRLGTVDAFGEFLISIRGEVSVYSFHRFFPRPSQYVVKATKEILLLHKLEN